MKIYQIYDGELFKLEVTETAKMYIAEKQIKAFDHKDRFIKRNCLLTQKDAITDYIKKEKGEIELLRGAITIIEKGIAKVQNKYGRG